ncbi:MAG TPA: hypothetical protein VGK51_14295 [Actinomycetota bacterium]|jgi:hypothetical protein
MSVRQRAPVLLVVLLVVAVVLGACAKKAPRTQPGSANPRPSATPSHSSGLSGIGLPPPSPTSNVSCAIVAVAEVNAALGTTATARHIDTTPPATVCTFAGGTSSRTVIVRIQNGEDANSFADDKAVYDSGGQTTATAVSGYGDEAFSSVLPVPGSVGVTTLVVRKGDVEVLVSAPTALGPVEALMQKILSQF